MLWRHGEPERRHGRSGAEKREQDTRRETGLQYTVRYIILYEVRCADFLVSACPRRKVELNAKARKTDPDYTKIRKWIKGIGEIMDGRIKMYEQVLQFVNKDYG